MTWIFECPESSFLNIKLYRFKIKAKLKMWQSGLWGLYAVCFFNKSVYEGCFWLILMVFPLST